MLDNFEVTGPKGTYQCVVHEPLLTSVLHFQAGFDPPSLPEDLLKGLLQQVLLALDYLHTEANVIHTGLYPLELTIFNDMQRKTKLTITSRHSSQKYYYQCQRELYIQWLGKIRGRRAVSTKAHTWWSNYIPKPHVSEPARLAQLRNAYTLRLWWSADRRVAWGIDPAWPISSSRGHFGREVDVKSGYLECWGSGMTFYCLLYNGAFWWILTWVIGLEFIRGPTSIRWTRAGQAAFGRAASRWDDSDSQSAACFISPQVRWKPEVLEWER